MPRYTSSSPSVSPTSHTYTSSNSNSHRSSVSSDSGSPRQRRPPPVHSDSGKDILKTSLVFLGVIGAASIAASRYWPKGVLYGPKESWAQEAKDAKEDVKHIMKGDRDHRRRSHNSSHGDQDSPRRRPPHVSMRDAPVAPGPTNRNMYVGAAPARQSDDDGSNQSRRRIVDPRERRRFSEEPLRSREFKASPTVE
ncbi:uncharacterized protein F4807DRAFT_228454 [Annulohypoxylon truncatum]|uniref:uncharacterized protein n=1 Tax=Annulohypoxylon truncatum TaxID=327061 RepID=UPI0020087318|nr:uncharacterized protein F4807DRAFT_228454 [Annulohypoxylon truncatum]KAI1206638.1 hypothetical protein F4807DRAFT_228454 [Annulohypoxylon truncatum]